MRKVTYIITTCLLMTFLFVGISHASDSVGSDTSFPVPRFISLGADEVNVRVGPGIRYPIKFVLKKEYLPVEVTKEFDVWREVQTIDGDKGWVHKSLLSGRRMVIIKDYTQTIYKDPNADAKPIVKLEPGVIARLSSCTKNWCQLKVASYKGWIEKDSIWGVYPDEIVKK